MELPPDNPEAWLRVIKEKGLGLELRIDLEKELMGSGQVLDTLARVNACRALIAAVSVYGRWTAVPHSLSDVENAAAKDMANALRIRSETDHWSALLHFVTVLGLYRYPSPAYEDDLRFDFAGAYLENPTGFRFFAKGSMLALGLTVSILAATQGKKEWDAAACREKADEMKSADLRMLHDLARLEGRWSGVHADSHKAVVQAAQVARQACGATLNGLEFKLHIPPGFDFEITLAQSSPAPKR